MTRLASSAALAVLALGACGKEAATDKAATRAPASQAIVQIDGSSTVFPISEAFGEEFQASKGARVTVGVSGTGGGFKKFCRGETDISAASRPIKKEEMEACAQSGVEFIELPVALDALAVIVNPAADWVDCISVEDLRKMWEPKAQGTVKNWNQISPEFPDRPLALFGAGVDSGTFDYFTAVVVGEEGSSRGDYTATEDDNVTITGVSRDPNALGYLGLAYVHENQGRVKTLSVRQADGACVAPTVETARNGTYQPFSRPLFYYVNRKAADEKEHVRAFVDYVFDPKTSEPLVSEVGYVALPSGLYEKAKQKFEARKTGTIFTGETHAGVGIEDLFQ